MLEDRRVLAINVSLAGSVVSFTGDGDGDFLRVQVNGARELEFSANLAPFTNDLDPAPGTQAVNIDTQFVRIHVNLGDGSDELDLRNSGAGGFLGSAADLEVAYDGGRGNNFLRVLDGSASSAQYLVGSGTGQGALSTAGSGGRLQSVTFQNLTDAIGFMAPVDYEVSSGVLQLTANGADNAITYSEDPIFLGRGLVTVDGFPSIDFLNQAQLQINGQGGSDTITLNNPNTPAGLTGITINGGDGSDTLNHTAAGLNSATTINLATSTIASDMANPVTFAGIERINSTGSTTLDIVGTAGPDSFDFAPTGPFDGTVVQQGADLAIQFSGLNGGFTVDPAGGSDVVTVNGTQAGETIDVSGSSVSVDGLKTINLANAEALRVFGQAGDDTFNVTPAASTSIFIDGGDPIGTTAGDSLNVLGGPATFEAGPENDEGGFVTPGSQRVSFDHIEAIGPMVGAPCAIVLGTNGDDDITIIARDAAYDLLADGVRDFTVSVNGGPEVLYLDVAQLYIEGLSGDDDIVLRTPAPNSATWDVDVFIAGGPPAAVTGDQGDVFELETPGFQDVVYSPTGIDSGTINITTLSALITLGAFTNACPSTPQATDGYNSSPGGVEQIVYQGLDADTLTINGNAADDSFVVKPSEGSGSHRSSLAPTFDFSGGATFTVNGGAGGFDTLTLLGTPGPDTVTSSTSSVTLGGTVNLGTGIDRLELYTFAGNDNVVLNLPGTALISRLVDAGEGNDSVTLGAGGSFGADIYGGSGDDSIIGSPGIDNIYGGPGNDVLIGGGAGDNLYGEDGDDLFGNALPTGDGVANDAGNDRFFGGEGSDTLVWDPGDGSDLFEGDEGVDVLRFNGSAAAENFTFNAVSGRLQLLRDVGAISMDLGGVEEVDLSLLGGVDSATVNDLFGTDVRVVNVNLGQDGAADTITVQGRTSADNLTADIAGATVTVTGLAYNINVTGSEVANDSLVINGNDGDDALLAAGAVASAIRPTLSGGAGNDTLIGSLGNETLDGGAGNDLFIGNGGTITVIGGAGNDAIVLPGSPGDDPFVLNMASGGTFLQATVLGVTTTYPTIPTASIEQIVASGGSGNDALSVNESGGAVPIPISFDGGAGFDSISLSGAPATSDTYSVGPDFGSGTSRLVISSVTQTINFSNMEPVFDTVAGPLVVNATNADNSIDYTQGSTTATGLVSIDAYEAIDFSNKTTLMINALGGSDTIHINNPNTPAGLTAITVIGGDPIGSDTLIVAGTSASNTLGITPTSFDAATITGVGPTITVTTIERLRYEGRGGSDTVNYATPSGVHHNIYEPSLVPDAATITSRNIGSGASLVPFEFADLGGDGSLTVSSGDPAASDSLELRGTALDDVFTVSTGGQLRILKPDGGTSPFRTIAINTVNIDELTLQGLDGDDTFDIPASQPFTAIFVGGGDPSASDVLDFTASGADIGVSLSDLTVGEVGNEEVHFSGIETLNVAAGAGAITVMGRASGETLGVRPAGINTARIQPSDLNLVVNTNNTGTLTIDSAAGNDTVTVAGTGNSDFITLIAGGADTTVQEGILKTVTLPTATTEALVINGAEGDDSLTVDVTGIDRVAIPLTFNGGSGEDRLTVTGTPAATIGSVTYTPGGGNEEGRLLYEGAAAPLLVIDFTDLEPIVDLVPAAVLAVNATSADNAINYTQGSSETTGLVSIDGFETIEFSNKTTLVLSGQAGSDLINLNNAATPTGLTGITVSGGDPSGSDTLIVTGTAGTDTLTVAPTSFDSATITGIGPTITASTIEHLRYEGRGGTDVLTYTTPSGDQNNIYEPGLAPDSASITSRSFSGGISLVPFQFVDLGANAVVTIAGGGGLSDHLELRGTPFQDLFTMSTAGQLRILKPVINGTEFRTIAINTSGVSVVTLQGMEGDDTFNVPGSQPYTTVFVDGGDPSASDVINFTATGPAVTVDLAGLRVGHTGDEEINFVGIEVLNVASAVGAITIAGRPTGESFDVTPTGGNTSRIVPGDLNLTINTDNTAGLTIDGAGGSDVLTVHGTEGSDTITVTAAAVTVNALKPIGYLNTEALRVFGRAGDDTFNVTAAANTTIFIDGGDPIGTTPGDRLNILGGPHTFEPGPESDEGGFVFAGAQRISFDHIEAIGPIVGSPCVIILGSQGDDDITVIARDASFDPLADGVQDFTVWVNGGPAILYINTPLLYIDGLAGDDDIVLRTPAPIVAVWAVNVFIAGGPPAAMTGDQGDVFELETPGTQTVNYTPTGSDSGTINLVTLSSLITLGAFTNACPSTPEANDGYNSSPGGVEQFVYDGGGGSDAFTITGTSGNDTIVHTPGGANDEGSLRVNNLLPVAYKTLSSAAVLRVDGSGGTESFVVYGTDANDALTVAASGAVALNSRLALNQTSVENLTLEGLSGDDTFNIPSGHPYAQLNIAGGNPSASDVLAVGGVANVAETITIARDAANPTRQIITGLGGQINVSGVELIRTSDAATPPLDNLTINITGDYHALVTKGDGLNDIVQLDAMPAIVYTNINTLRVVNPSGQDGENHVRFNTTALIGALTYQTSLGFRDTLIIDGTDSAGDLFTVTKPASGSVTVAHTTGGNGTRVTDTGTSLGRLEINGQAGNDSVVVNVAGTAPISVPMTVNGGGGADSLTIQGTPTTAIAGVTYTPGGNVEDGSLLYSDAAGARLMSINFTDLEPVVDLAPAATLTVNGINADNAINYTQGGVAANGLVSIDGFESIEFSNKTTLVLNGLGGSDTVNLNNANTPTGLTGITVNGGDPTESDTLIVTGTTGTDVLTVAPSSFDAVTITGIGPTITAATIEHLRYEGRGGTDALTFQTPSGAHHNIFEPGLIFDSGTITSRGFAPGTSLLPFEFADLGADGPLTFADAGGARSDGLELRGTAFDDLFTVSASGQARVFKPDPTTRRTPPINTPGIANLTLQGLEGDDTFNAPGNHPFALFIVEGGDPSASDVLNFTGSGPAVTVGLVVPNLSQAGSSAISFSGIEVVNVSAGAGSILIGGRTTAESIDVTPTGATTAQIQPADLNFVVNTDNTGLLLLDPVGGSDLVAIHGTSASDAITTARNGTNTTAQVATLKTVTLISANTEALVIAGAEGDDTLTVNVAGTDLLAVPLTFDGGAGRDLLVVSGDPTVTVNSVSYSPGPSVGAGRLAYDSTGTDMVLDFVGLEPVVDLVPAAMLVVNATSADNAINYVRGSVAANGLVSVDNLETIEFSNKATLTINALAGSDTINLNNPETPTGLTGITIEGGDPTTSDMLIANGKPLLLDKFNYMPVGQDSGSIIALGSPTVNFDGIEHVKINAYGDGELTYTTSDPSGLAYIPGSSPDSATVTGHTIGGTSLPPLEFFGLGGGNEFFFASFSNDRTNTLDFYGTNDSDQFSIDGSGSGRLELVRQGGGRVTFYVHTAGIRLLLLRGLDGDDLYNVDGTAPWVDGLVLDGGNPSASDVVNLSGATGPATVQLADPSIIVIPPIQTTVTGYGGEVTLLGIEKANLALSGNNLTVVGTSQDDTITYTPSGPAAGNFEAADLNTVFHFTQAAGAAANAFVIDGGPGVANTVSVNGTAGRDLFSINEIARTAAVTPVVATWQPVTLAANIQVLNARGLTGQDTFLVTPAAGTQFAANPPFFPIGNIDNLLVNVDGGSGSGENNALVIATPAGATLAANQFVVLNRGADGTSGTARTFTAGVQWPDINYVHVQVVSPKVATTTFNGQTGPNLLTIGPDLNEPNETQFAAAFLGADSTLQVQHGAIFPSANEFPFVPSDQDFYRVVAQVTGTLDVQVYFHLFNPALLPAGGNLDVQAFDAAGHRIADAAVTGGIDSNTGSAGPPVFGSLGTSGTARVRFPAVAGQSFFFRVVGYSPGPAGSATTAAQVVNGYDVTVINTPPPVPYDLELDDLPVNPLYVCPQVNPAAANSDTGRSQFDNFTCDATPTIRFRLDDAIFFQDLPGNPVNGLPPGGVIPIGYSLELGGVTFPGFRVAVFDEGQPQQGGALPQVPLGFATPIAPGVYEFTTPTLTDGSHFLTARVQMVDPATPQQTGLGDHSQSLEIVADTQPPPVFLGLPNVPDDGLLPGSDTGVNANPHTLSDRVTSDTTPGFFGQAEADSVIRLFIDFPVNPDGSGDGIFEPSTDFQVGFDVAKPYDGTNQYPSGYWQVDAINFNLNAAPFPIGGPRTIFVTAEDVAGNINPASDVIRLDVFIDTSGPQVTDVDINSVTSTYDLFDPKPSTEGPTPPVNSLVISFRDLPPRTAAFLVEALKQDVAASPGLYQLRGDANGIIPIQQVIVTNLPPQVGQPALATVELVFRLPGPDGIFNTPDDIGAPLPDDRFALTVDGDIIDLTGNHLDGESNATQPLESPSFPSGDKLPGGDFVARFTIDSRPEIGNYSAGSAFIDINGNYFIDPQGDAADYTNRDLVFQIGTISDALFAGKFEPASMAQNDNDGFDKLGAYGYDNSAKKYRFLLDFDHDGVSDLRIVSAFQVNAIPVAGNFAPNHPGDEIGLFDGQNWYLDTLGDNQLHVKIASDMGGQPIVGDFNGDGRDDLATYDAAKNKFFFDTNRDGRADDSLQLNGPFNGYTDLPFAGDMNLDGIDDLGIWVPNRQGSPTANISEWYFIVSDRVGQSLPHNVFDHYAPTPLGNDLFAQFGDHFSLPIFGNFDPPVSATSASSQTNSLNPLDVNNDGSVSPIDALLIINQINAGTRQQRSAAVATPPFLDVNADKSVSAIDALMVINYLNSQAAKIGSEAEGESADAILAAADRSSADVLREDLLAILAAETATVRPRVLRAF